MVLHGRITTEKETIVPFFKLLPEQPPPKSCWAHGELHLAHLTSYKPHSSSYSFSLFSQYSSGSISSFSCFYFETGAWESFTHPLHWKAQPGDPSNTSHIRTNNLLGLSFFIWIATSAARWLSSPHIATVLSK